jgi:penicillin amidase
MVADWDAALTEAAGRAEERLRAELGPPQDWAWRRLHTTGIRHPVSRELDPPSFGCGGDRDTVWASGAETGLGIEHASVARYVFDLGDWERSGWIVPLGASGDPSSPHYADQAADWAAVRLRPMPYDWTRIEQGAEAHRRLEPS